MNFEIIFVEQSSDDQHPHDQINTDFVSSNKNNNLNEMDTPEKAQFGFL
jgi:hypothetical protein